MSESYPTLSKFNMPSLMFGPGESGAARRGQVILLVGRHGVGKTTMINDILCTPTATRRSASQSPTKVKPTSSTPPKCPVSLSTTL
jgi:translation initiation factor RLI1